MGVKVKAICKCGLSAEILIGGGKLNYHYIEYFPCLCVDCKDVVQVNLKAGKPSCPTCYGNKVIPYIDDRLIGLVGDSEVVNWSGKRLTNGTYKYPKCNQMTLEFSPSFYMWD